MITMFVYKYIFVGLAGKDVWQQALVDQYIELVEDMFMEVAKAFFEKDEAKKVTCYISKCIFQFLFE